MTEQSFSLIPFPASHIPDVTVTGRFCYQDSIVSVSYTLAGDLGNIILPHPSARAGRRDGLWKQTCFEFFLALRNQPHYWEFNLSPSGDWNAYRMDAYRRIGFREETSVQRAQISVEKRAGTFNLEGTLDISQILQISQPLEVAITAVLQTKQGGESYWALTHPGPQADFHLRESFILTLATQTHPSGRSVPGG